MAAGLMANGGGHLESSAARPSSIAAVKPTFRSSQQRSSGSHGTHTATVFHQAWYLLA
jgi:hypothetical protein